MSAETAMSMKQHQQQSQQQVNDDNDNNSQVHSSNALNYILTGMPYNGTRNVKIS